MTLSQTRQLVPAMTNRTEPSATALGKVVEVNGPIWRGEVWKADGLTLVRLPDGRVKAFGPRAVYSVDFGQPQEAGMVA